ncbi:hypothetical protein JZ751_012524 [Albula glossodonta]|uniref:Uncharacterized protein n=1 Tax=Albula glossodonta TaxID=121402 RepID=A0A8T2P5V1_9TELE|nr:hypothetical protein JZ751_012524 [Albula glossodonta]
MWNGPISELMKEPHTTVRHGPRHSAGRCRSLPSQTLAIVCMYCAGERERERERGRERS